ncbi:MAG: dethiobiotin synthase [Solirubrobacteraceae bacterium]
MPASAPPPPRRCRRSATAPTTGSTQGPSTTSRSPAPPDRSLRGLFVTGTDTGVGKTVVAAAICAALRARGERVAAFKPVVTGLDEPADPDWPVDHELLAAASGGEPERVAPHRFGPVASPHLAARLADVALAPRSIVANARSAGERADVLVVEGVGGLLVPLTRNYAIADLARDLELPLLVVARPGLGTINHTLLTLEAARARGLAIAAVVLTPWPSEPTDVERSNLESIADLGAVEIATLERVGRGDSSLLAESAGGLPISRWVGAPSSPEGR